MPGVTAPTSACQSLECFRRVNSGGECGAPRGGKGRVGGRHGVRGDSGGVSARGPGFSPDLCPPRAPLAPCFHHLATPSTCVARQPEADKPEEEEPEAKRQARRAPRRAARRGPLWAHPALQRAIVDGHPPSPPHPTCLAGSIAIYAHYNQTCMISRRQVVVVRTVRASGPPHGPPKRILKPASPFATPRSFPRQSSGEVAQPRLHKPISTQRW